MPAFWMSHTRIVSDLQTSEKVYAMTSTKLFRLSLLFALPRGLAVGLVILVALALAWAGASIAGAQEDTGIARVRCGQPCQS